MHIIHKAKLLSLNIMQNHVYLNNCEQLHDQQASAPPHTPKASIKKLENGKKLAQKNKKQHRKKHSLTG